MSIIHKIREKAGFSIAELLVAILILSMVSTVVAGGIPVARDAYNRITVAANAQVLLSTAIYSLRSELSMASEIEIQDDAICGYAICYRSGKNGHKSKIYVGLAPSGEKAIMIQEFDDEEKPKKPTPRELVPGMSKDGLHVFCSMPPLNSGGEFYITIDGLTVKKNSAECGVDATSLTIHTMEKVKLVTG